MGQLSNPLIQDQFGPNFVLNQILLLKRYFFNLFKLSIHDNLWIDKLTNDILKINFLIIKNILF
jgi:hypothetical protein